MEQLILFAIIAIVSSIFGKSKNKKPQKQMPPFNKDTMVEPPVTEETPHRTGKAQSFEDFARDFIGEWIPENQKAEEPKVEAQKKKEVPSYVAPPLLQADVPSRSSNRENRGRLAAGKKEAHTAVEPATFRLPQSKNELVQAIVMAEILGPPKAKRK
ncbi:hypothetical protein AB1J28_06990 [Lysinibacillus irui]|uniref:hypothetical protein n=1 Tax=Lysinibacillus irui TaxID=2998077 RepID=UPI003D27E64F